MGGARGLAAPIAAALNWAATGAGTGQRGRETGGAGVRCRCSGVHQLPRVVKKGVWIWGGGGDACGLLFQM